MNAVKEWWIPKWKDFEKQHEELLCGRRKKYHLFLCI